MAGGGKGQVDPPPLSRSLSRGGAASLGRRVSFKENHMAEGISIRGDHNDVERGPRGRGTCGTCCNMWCAWASFIIWTLIIVCLIIGVAFFAFVQSNLPEVRVQRLDIYGLNVTNSKNKETQLNLDLEFKLNVTNKNEKIGLTYGTMNVETTIEAFELDKARVSGFHQDPETTKDLKIRTKLNSKSVNEDDAKELEEKSKIHDMVFNLKIRGTIEFAYKDRKMSKLVLKVLCLDIEQSVVDQALAPKCLVKLSPFG